MSMKWDCVCKLQHLTTYCSPPDDIWALRTMVEGYWQGKHPFTRAHLVAKQEGLAKKMTNLPYEVTLSYARFQVLTAAKMKFRFVFWDVLPCKIIVDWRFRGTFYLHHQFDDGGISLMMEAARTSDTSVDNYFTRQYIPEDKSELYLFRTSKGSLTCHNIFLHGAEGLTSSPKEGVLRIFFALKNPFPRTGFNQRTLDQVASTLTTRPPRGNLVSKMRSINLMLHGVCWYYLIWSRNSLTLLHEMTFILVLWVVRRVDL
jgi:hypothetical protein